MTDATDATLIVTLFGTDDFAPVKKRILKVKGVNTVELNRMTGKLRVRYDGDPERNLEIQAQIRKIIAS